jgi:hypothetical protein
MNEEQFAWENLLKSDGWLLFKQEARRRWGPEGYARELKQAVMKAREQKMDVEAAIVAVDVANDAINAILSYPDHRLKIIAEHVAREQGEQTISRRGPNL